MSRTSQQNEQSGLLNANGRKPIVIDFHAHFAVPEVMDFTYENSVFAKALAKKGAGDKPQQLPEPLLTRLLDNSLRIKEMDKMGVDIQVVSPTILQQCTYFAEPEQALKLERLSNDRLADLVAEHPGRLVGLGSVPLQDTGLAIQELERAVKELKLKGVIVGSSVNGMELGDMQLRPFWKKAEELQTAIFIHPAGNTDPKMARHRMLISIGQPLEEAFAMSSLVYDGVMDDCPNVKIAIAHGGGYLPFYTGRHDHLYRTNQAGTDLKGDFSSYLNRFHYDSALFNVDMLEFLATKTQPGRIMLATDYPFGEKDPVGYVQRAAKISQADRDAILGANAAAFLGMDI
jgi:aminocarboxymuconate-semialdehyde decarboxylase